MRFLSMIRVNENTGQVPSEQLMTDMLPETSIARMIVSCCDGSVTTAAGRAIATIISVSAHRNKSGGTWRRKRLPTLCASRTIDRLA